MGAQEAGLEVVPASDVQSQGSSRYSHASSTAVQRRATSLDYLSRSGQHRETVRDYIQGSRKILLAQIAINNKTEECELLKEYIIMEKDKLEEGKKSFLED